ncbi:hypothetical protein EAL2_c13220 [Peptoclostridium acidaminophilum DSM 3953]|uniref:Ribosomal protein eL8/eL30/eS12/Gadd45 domain-containing protein n=1 Tax=Peptoclostridium acidaminophilum DSM 3953 TaxID=1286171 RepID=W8TK92_PEPAC|nr:ribosomal L7Ae/L30e/S12e/Gadd45 family protein [Peptoclostridium acidaminophilum]AHM56617.1 hypothetical protein EAL2_c13220 [Peptoclostridium acidaminophilum DSM 3953]
MKSSVLTLLGFAAKSGNLVTGEDALVNEIRRNSLRLLIIAQDASDNTKKKLSDKAKSYGVDFYICFSKDEISRAIGKENRAAVGIKNAEFHKRLKELLGGEPYVKDKGI